MLLLDGCKQANTHIASSPNCGGMLLLDGSNELNTHYNAIEKHVTVVSSPSSSSSQSTWATKEVAVVHWALKKKAKKHYIGHKNEECKEGGETN